MAKQRTRTSAVTEIADFAGVSRQTIYDWQKLPGYPRAPDGSVALWDLCEWRCRAAGADVSPETEGGSDSPGLERFRDARAEQEEIKLAEMKRQVVAIDWMHARLNEIASLIRGAGEQLQREYGPDALQILEDAIAEAEGKIKDLGSE